MDEWQTFINTLILLAKNVEFAPATNIFLSFDALISKTI